MGKTKRKKIVVDTNVAISALGWGGHPDELIRKVAKGELLLYISPEIIDEIIEVMNYPKFNFTVQRKQALLSILKDKSIMVEPKRKIQIIEEDPSDNMFLECAVSAKVDYIVSGDKHLLSLKEFNDIKIIKVADFLREFQEVNHENESFRGHRNKSNL